MYSLVHVQLATHRATPASGANGRLRQLESLYRFRPKRSPLSQRTSCLPWPRIKASALADTVELERTLRLAPQTLMQQRMLFSYNNCRCGPVLQLCTWKCASLGSSRLLSPTKRLCQGATTFSTPPPSPPAGVSVFFVTCVGNRTAFNPFGLIAPVVGRYFGSSSPIYTLN